MLTEVRFPRHAAQRYPTEQPSHVVSQPRWQDHQYQRLEHHILGANHRPPVHQPRPALGSQERSIVVMPEIWQRNSVNTAAVARPASQGELPGYSFLFHIVCGRTAIMLPYLAWARSPAVDVPYTCWVPWTAYPITQIRAITER